MKLDNYQLGFKRLNVVISNPPKRGVDYPTEGGTPTIRGGNGREEGGGFKKPSFIPFQARRAASYATNEPDPL